MLIFRSKNLPKQSSQLNSERRPKISALDSEKIALEEMNLESVMEYSFNVLAKEVSPFITITFIYLCQKTYLLGKKKLFTQIEDLSQDLNLDPNFLSNTLRNMEERGLISLKIKRGVCLIGISRKLPLSF